MSKENLSYIVPNMGDSDVEDEARWFNSLADHEAAYESPVDLNLTKLEKIELPALKWYNHELMPKKMKITNTGHTLILSGKWYQERPYVTKGPFLGNYVFSQLHFHWGRNDAEGSEHTVDGVACPVEMHVVTFKAGYLTQEAALKEKDGISVLAYLFKLQGGKNPVFQKLIDHIHDVQQAHSSFKLTPMPLEELVKPFHNDYFLYWGSVKTTACIHYIIWLIAREPVGISSEQVEELRMLMDTNDEPLNRNFREAHREENRQIFHVSPSSFLISTLLPLP